MTALYSVAEIRKIESEATASLPAGTLMQRAGAAAAQAAMRLLPGYTTETRILVIAGPGNNGGDALEAAAHLAQAGMQVTVLLYADPAKQTGDSQRALQKARAGTANFPDTAHFRVTPASGYALVLDGLFGIGLTRPITGALHTLVEQINLLNIPILALDVPSGLDADTGNLVGQGAAGIRATHTITFIGGKPGLYTGSGRDYAGEVEISDLGIDDKYFPQAHSLLTDIGHFAESLRQRAQNSHKGSYGNVILVGGAHGMTGAPILAARAALKCGAGRVYAAFVDDAPAYDGMQPELMCRSASGMDLSSATLVIGPGLGYSHAAHDLLAKALDTHSPLLLDADALNLIAAEPELQRKLACRSESALITPHPLEAARLLAGSSTEVQSNRLAAARELARRFNAITVLKGSGTVIARPDSDVAINPTGNPALATAGTGDVLAGVCGALLAQGWPLWHAALAAVWLHGKAADMLVEQGIGPIGVTAGELIPMARIALNLLVSQHARRRPAP